MGKKDTRDFYPNIGKLVLTDKSLRNMQQHIVPILPETLYSHSITNDSPFPKNQTYPERSDNVFWEKNQDHFYLRFLALSL